jgi:hypothetical protein
MGTNDIAVGAPSEGKDGNDIAPWSPQRKKMATTFACAPWSPSFFFLQKTTNFDFSKFDF